MYAKRLKINLCYVALSKTHTQGHLSKTLQTTSLSAPEVKKFVPSGCYEVT